MALDPVDLFGESLWRFIQRAGLFVSALVVGGAIGELAVEFRDGLPDLGDLADPFLEASRWAYSWVFTSAAPLVIGLMCVFIISNWSVYWWWVGTVALISAAVTGQYDSPARWGWLVWFVLTIMVTALVWYLKAWQQTRWARELMTIEAENRFLRSEAEEAARAEVERLREEG
jgi:hypothetical protein